MLSFTKLTNFFVIHKIADFCSLTYGLKLFNEMFACAYPHGWLGNRCHCALAVSSDFDAFDSVVESGNGEHASC